MRVYLHTFGCKANQYDTETVRQALEDGGATVVDQWGEADVAVVNSCTVTHVAEAKMRGLVRRMARERRDIRTVVMGCAAALDDGSIARLPGVAGVVGGGDPVAVLKVLDIPAPAAGSPLRAFARGGRGWLKIQDGCDEHCTFCATTLARGDSRSRLPATVVEEARALSQNHAELVLTGVHIGSYGADLEGESLGTLVERLVVEVPEVRFRLSSVEATEVDDRLADLLLDAPEHLAPHLHAPLQSGSDRVLKRMGRHWYTAARYQDRIEWLAARAPAFGLGADVMVGFPGETGADHRATLEVVQSLPFTYLHVFPYSERPGTVGGRLGVPVEPRIAAQRSAELRETGLAKGAAYRAGRDGQYADIVITGRSHGRYQGLTEDYLEIELETEAPVERRFEAELRTANGRIMAEVSGTRCQVSGRMAEPLAPGP
ncbi:MAG: MiaB/RimO family radical SAM methylthiotransferase [Gemmatimonadetes bacterium]|nr:MiaB/RimO family radical SAM methylthiotransferase [Gemmatimonadota bacterium]